MKKSLFFLFSALIFCSCNSNKLDEEKFSQVYVELIIAEDTSSLNPRDFKKIIFEKYGVTDQQYNNTVEDYKTSPEKWEAFFNKTLDILEKRKQALSK